MAPVASTRLGPSRCAEACPGLVPQVLLTSMAAVDGRFELLGWAVEGRLVRLNYRLCGGVAKEPVQFQEQLQLPEGIPAPDPTCPRVRALLDLVHRTFGVSYFKAACPGEVRAEPAHPVVADYCELLYRDGLGEFYFQNRLVPPQLHFPSAKERKGPLSAHPSQGQRPERVLVLIGGGKDSVVAREVVRHAGVEASGFSLGTAPYIRSSAKAMGVAHHEVVRRIDPQLLALNAAGALNGHVPISACVATVAVLCAELGGYDGVVVANERSADEGNVSYRGMAINHQWSKSSVFERVLGDVLDAILEAPPRYFSLLRPLSELAIGRAFLHHPQYFDAVTSCNKNFRIAGNGPVARWCGTCPKCIFVYLILAVHAADADLDRIFGLNPLAIPENSELLQQLSGLTGLKPFECVGTFEESRAALYSLAQQGRLPQPALACWQALEASGEAALGAGWLREAMTPCAAPLLPQRWQERLDAYLRTYS